jgi:hypothetical protein
MEVFNLNKKKISVSLAAIMIFGNVVFVHPAETASAAGVWNTSKFSSLKSIRTSRTNALAKTTAATAAAAAAVTPAPAPATTQGTTTASTTSAAAATAPTTPVTTTTTSPAAAVDGYSCKTLGMIPNDSGKAQANYKLMLAALKSGKKIIVDDSYYLDSVYWSAVDGNLITSDIVIKGTDKTKNKLIMVSDGAYFNVKGNVTIQGITLQGKSAGDAAYLLELAAPYRLSVHINDNYITGNIRMMTSRIPENFNFSTTDCGITELDISNNEFYDIYDNGGVRTIFFAQDTPVTTCSIKNNKVTNFSYIFYDNSITNDHPYDNYIAENSRNTYIEDNIVKCTDDYDATAKNGGKIGYYYCFTLLEANSVECRRNTFEGIHVINSPGTAVYDNYFTVKNLVYEDNIWKNNVNFTAGEEYVDIMKSKQSVLDHPTRVYKRNHYITEASYADKFGQDRYLLRKEMDTYQQWIDSVVIEDNQFDMYILDSPRTKTVINYTFNNNTLNLYTQESAVWHQAYIGIIEYRDESGNLVPRTLAFTNNKINTLNPPLDGKPDTYSRYIVSAGSNAGANITIKIENNYIKAYNMDGFFENQSSFRGTLSNVNNTIIGQ